MRPLGWLLLPLLSTSAMAEVRVPALFSPGMVLQHGEPVPVWGWATPGEPVTVRFQSQTATTKADARGAWKVTLGPLRADRTPGDLIVQGTNRLAIGNVLVGEVWLCSGQSNMEWPLSRTEGAEDEVAKADYPAIRMFTVTNATADTPQTDCSGKWQTAAPNTVAAWSAVGYHYARLLHLRLGLPVGMIDATWGGTVVEAWTDLAEFQKDPKEFASTLALLEAPNVHPANRPGKLYNGMIAPLIPYRLAGAIWYQGESNAWAAWRYRTLFPMLIANWRRAWGQDRLPFYFVQIAPYRYAGADPRAAAELREAQLTAMRTVPDTGMAVTMDIGDPANIHPPNKRDVADRLARWAFAKTYRLPEIVFSGPEFRSLKVEGNTLRLRFDHAARGLRTRDGASPSHFTIAGKDQKFVPAQARIEGDTLVVWAEGVPNPVAVRYAWADDATPNLANAAGLPASSFRSDRWTPFTLDHR
ncbi:MAG: hypothetical protein KIS66_15045 [Fimbriimonadaceae bacterium]|nr:hypothetical protein [Fimbriimonadaceae bacterium]